jgi:hypothetical protein
MHEAQPAPASIATEIVCHNPMEAGTVKTEAQDPKPLPKTLPDWKPLGAIRDYFAEQMRQDNFTQH